MTDNVAVASAYYTNGAAFQTSARRLADNLALDDRGCPTSLEAIPFYFLASHAAELYLKAALLKRGAQPQTLKGFDFRHNLAALLGEITAKNLPVTPATATLIDGLSEQHRRHTLRYDVLHGPHTVSWPPVAATFSALDELLLLCRVSTHGR